MPPNALISVIIVALIPFIRISVSYFICTHITCITLQRLKRRFHIRIFHLRGAGRECSPVGPRATASLLCRVRTTRAFLGNDDNGVLDRVFAVTGKEDARLPWGKNEQHIHLS